MPWFRTQVIRMTANKISRKAFLRRLAVAAGAATLPSLAASADVHNPSANAKVGGLNSPADMQMLAARKKARFRVRRIIMNNDGNDSSLNVDKPLSRELFLAKRTSPLTNSQVDTIFYCDGVNGVYSHLSDVTELPKQESKRRFIEYLKEFETDTLTVMVDFCHQHGKEIFWSMRMNDNHDATTENEFISDFKKKHPELLVGKKGVKMPMMPNKWSPFDYGKEEVRTLAVNICRDVVSRYDIDGIELDFFRHPAFFREQFYGEKITQAQCDKMTSMVREIRKVCDMVAVNRNRPVLLAVRVPDSLGFSRAIGLDWEQWLKEDLIDLLTGADYIKFEPWKNFAEIGHKYHVPVYACLEQRRLSSRGGSAERETTVEQWRGEAYIALTSGIDGIYTFNRFDPHDQIFNELGDISLLAGLPREKKESYCGEKGIGYLDPDYWLKDGRSYLRMPVNNKDKK